MFTFFLRFKTRVTLVLAFLSLSVQSQSLHNFFEEKNDEKIQAWIKENPAGKVSVFNERLSVFYENRFPVSMLSCVAQEIHVLPLAILYENEKIVTELLRNPKIKSDSDLMSEAFKFAVAKNKLDWAKEIEKSCPELNKPSAYFFGKNALQIALSTPIDSDLLQFVIQSSSDEVFLHLDCFGKSVLHYMAEYNHFELYQDKNQVISTHHFLSTSELVYPIELAIGNGHFALVNLMWEGMRKQDGFSVFLTPVNLKRLKYQAIKSKDEKMNLWVDKKIIKNLNLTASSYYSIFLNADMMDLNKLIDEFLITADMFFDLSSIGNDVAQKNFIDYIKDYQSYKSRKINVDAAIAPTYHGRSKLIPLNDVIYISQFYSHYSWNQLWSGKLSDLELDELAYRQLPFALLGEQSYPEKYTNAFRVNYALLLGFDGEAYERLIFMLNNLDVHFLQVQEVRDWELDYMLFFPNLQFIELIWQGEGEDFFVPQELLGVPEFKINNVQTLHFPERIDRGKLQHIHVSSETVIENLPKGVKVSYF